MADGEWRAAEIYSEYLKISGMVKIPPMQRLSDVVNRFNDDLEVEDVQTSMIGSPEGSATEKDRSARIAKKSILLVCPGEKDQPSANSTLKRNKFPQRVAIFAGAFAIQADVPLEPKATMEQLLRRQELFFPVTRLSAVWLPSMGGRRYVFSREFALINPAAIVSYSLRSTEPLS